MPINYYGGVPAVTPSGFPLQAFDYKRLSTAIPNARLLINLYPIFQIQYGH